MIYEYECPVCHEKVEEIKPLRDRDCTPKCKKCVDEVLTKRVMSASIFKINGYNESNGYSKCEKGA